MLNIPRSVQFADYSLPSFNARSRIGEFATGVGTAMQSGDLARQNMARDVLEKRYKSNISPDEIKKAEIMQAVKNAKASNPNLANIPEELIYKKFIDAEMQKNQDNYLRSQADVKGYLGSKESDLNRDDVGALKTMHNKYLSHLNQLLKNRQEDDPQVQQARANLDKITSRLRELGVDVIGTVEQIPEEEKEMRMQSIDAARKEAIDLINTAEDKTGALGVPDGVIDNADDISQGLDSIARKYNINTADDDWKRVVGLYKDKGETIKEVAKAGSQEEQTRFEREMKKKTLKLSKGSIDSERAKYAIGKLKDNPDTANIYYALNDVLLRSETGAAIAKEETMGRLQSVLPSEYTREMLSDRSGVQAWLSDKVVTDDMFRTQLIKKYIDRVDPKKITEQLRIGSGESAESVLKREKANTAPTLESLLEGL